MANTNKKRIHFAFLDKFEKQIAQLKKFASHIGLYLGLFLYTLVGAWIFILIEHPVEKEKLETIQGLLKAERFNFLRLVHNITKELAHMDNTAAVRIEGRDPELFSRDTIKSMLLSTNQFRPHWENDDYYKVDNLVNAIDTALLDYEKTVAVAASEGINITSQECLFKWTYVQSVFFSSTVITTVGYGHMAPVTVGGRLFCILFAIIGIPFTLSVIADVGQITATLVSTVWAKAKPILNPMVDKIKRFCQRIRDFFAKRKRNLLRGRKRKPVLSEFSSKSDDEDELEDQKKTNNKKDEAEIDEEDPMESIGIAANVAMAFAALGFLCIFLSMGGYIYAQYEGWSFFDAFYFCLITMTTIGFGDIVPNDAGYMFLCMIYILVGLAVTSTIIELVRRQYAESWQKMQDLRAQIQAQLKLADHLRKMAEQGRDLEGMDVDIDELRRNINRLKKGRFGAFLGDFDLDALDNWINNKRKVKAVTIFFYETSL